MRYTYKTQGTCSTSITFDLEDGIVRNVAFSGGCDGNLKAVSRLVDGFTADRVAETLGGIRCGFKSTSCGDQLARAVRKAQANPLR